MTESLAARSLAENVRADAATRSSFRGARPTSGKDDKGLFISDGEAFKLYVKGNVQLRYVANWRAGVGPNDDFTDGFSNRRTRGGLEGTVVDKRLSFGMYWEWGRDATSPEINEAYVKWKDDGGWTLTAGQTKLPFWREENMSFLNQLAVERSAVNGVFTQGYSQLLMLDAEGQHVRGWAALSDGFNSINSNYNSSKESDYALTAHGEVKWAGEWKPWSQFTSFRGDTFGAYSGGAIHFQNSGKTGGTLAKRLLTWTLDTGVKGDGWNAFAAYVGRELDDRTLALRGNFTDHGWLAQAGLMIAEQHELFARYEGLSPDAERNNGKPFHAVTTGLNYYISPKSHAAKLTVDLVYVPVATARSAGVLTLPNLACGILSSPERNQFVFRTQMQLAF
ncbi:MAG: porin [Planctomycetota bacterium]|nr:porin [Planctomycetota bacterium]